MHTPLYSHNARGITRTYTHNTHATQIPGVTVWYGPDTYMGSNLAALFTQLAALPDEQVAALHPGHSQASIKALLPQLR